MNKITLLIGAGILSISTAAIAADEQRRGNGQLAELDSDGDERISFDEFQRGESLAFARIDSNGDGVLSIDEFLNGRPGPMDGNRGDRPDRGDRGDGDRQQREPSAEQRALMQEMMKLRASEQFQEMDRDGDDLVSLAEYQEATFLRLDRDNNGAITAQEMRPQRREGAGRRGQNGPRGGQAGGRPPRA